MDRSKELALKVIAIDDEPHAIDMLSTFLDYNKEFHLIASFSNTKEAEKFLKYNKVDLIFLDIKMPGQSGIEFYRNLTEKPPVIFTTAHADYALEGYDLGIIDYLLKPFSAVRFKKSLERSKQYLFKPVEKNEIKLISIKSGFELIRINIEDIMYVSSLGNYVRIIMKDEEVLGNHSLKDINELINSMDFIQVHRSYLINKKYVTKLSKNTLHIDDVLIPIGETFLKNVKLFFK